MILAYISIISQPYKLFSIKIAIIIKELNKLNFIMAKILKISKLYKINIMDANTENITVAVRIRPMLQTDNISDTI